MSGLEDRRVDFLRKMCLITICFQIVFCFFYVHLPAWLQVILFSSIPAIFISLVLLKKYSKYRFAAFTFLFFAFVHQAFTFFYLAQGTRINIGAALMMGSLCIVSSVMVGQKWGIFVTGLAVVFISSEIS